MIKWLQVLFLLSVFTTMSLHAQKRPLKNRFNAGIIIGANTSQINGDHLSGFDKVGFFAGFRAIAKLNTKTELVVEMQYNRKGSRDPDRLVPDTQRDRFFSLHYIEVPILFHKKVEAKIGLVSLEAGIAYARLFGFKINENVNSINYTTFTSLKEELNNDDLALIMGGGIFIGEHIRLMGRFSFSMTLLYKNENPTHIMIGQIPGINELRNLQLAFGVNYIF